MNETKINELEYVANNLILDWYIDADGVLLRSVDAVVDILNARFNKSVLPQDITNWNFSCSFDVTDQDIEDIFSSDEFFERVKFQDGAIDFLKRNKEWVDVITKGTDRNIELKRKLFADNGLGDINIIGLPLNISKDIVDMKDGVFVDDVVSNLNDVRTARYKVLFKEYDNYTQWSDGWNGMILRSWK